MYAALAARPAEEWRDQFRASPFHRRYVADRLAGLSGVRDDDECDTPGEAAGRTPTHPIQQAWVLTRRYLAVWKGDRAAGLALAGQSLLVAVLLVAVFGRLADVTSPTERAVRTNNLLFLLAVSSFWLGCNTAAKELVKERAIYARERAVNLRADSYLVSKLGVLTLIGVAQVTLVFVVTRLACGPPGSALGQWAALALLAVAGTALGLLLSAVSRTEEVALALVPVAVIPQIILAGVIAPLGGWVDYMARGMVGCYWGQQALVRLLPEAERAVLGVAATGLVVPSLVLVGHAFGCWTLTLIRLGRSSTTSSISK